MMDPDDGIIAGPDGVFHAIEKAQHHNTWCGRFVPNPMVLARRGPVTCVECIGGPSYLRISDVIFGTDVLVLIVGTDPSGKAVTSPAPCRFTKGVNDTSVAWAGNGKTIDAFLYLRLDGIVLHVSRIQPITAIEGDTVRIERGSIQLRAK